MIFLIGQRRAFIGSPLFLLHRVGKRAANLILQIQLISISGLSLSFNIFLFFDIPRNFIRFFYTLLPYDLQSKTVVNQSKFEQLQKNYDGKDSSFAQDRTSMPKKCLLK